MTAQRDCTVAKMSCLSAKPVTMQLNKPKLHGRVYVYALGANHEGFSGTHTFADKGVKH